MVVVSVPASHESLDHLLNVIRSVLAVVVRALQQGELSDIEVCADTDIFCALHQCGQQINFIFRSRAIALKQCVNSERLDGCV